ncbi:hypothetical protein SAMN05421810_10183 [Amycolatopsis arida]|uniref:Phage major capsid protein, HK97 family n=1 Tax=Amycolatopsis arida TaxID=587909 RepID=A0A1I5KC62_9PSEU|nr:DUF5309 family protein [Amycolatopsis arida]TDX96979.1 hypothetical protein CLV69_10281 [Amycolatopsis arida]SFO82558.1 hypothetical protein SAMN05421810_10183 [Amycolatopsis arida]
MPGITEMLTTYNSPNYVGQLFSLTPTDTPLLSSIGGLTGGQATDSTIFTWQSYDLRDPDANRQRVEGADAPPPEARVRQNAFNVVEIHQEALSITYTREAANGQFAGTGSAVPTSAAVTGTNPVGDELVWQTQRHLEQIARDIEVSFISGQFAQPADNTQPRRTRGLLQAIQTNVITHATPTPLSEETVVDLLQQTWENGGLTVSETATLICNAFQKRQLTKAFIADKGYREQTRNVGGVALQTVETDFGRLNIMLNRYMPADTVVVASLDELAPVFLRIPGRGFLFTEPLAKTGASDRYQIYGEVGLRYGNERSHGKITGLTTAPQSA